MKFKADQTSQKLRGGYYTPENLADYVTRWVLEKSPKNILEPSCGDGIFFKSISNHNYDKNIHLTAFELFDSEANKARALTKHLNFSNATIIEGDFLEWANQRLQENTPLFDGVLGNPPFIRYQFLEKEFQLNTENVFKTLDLKFTKHTNAWVPFILASVALLKGGGRLGMVIPSEIIHVLHAQQLRTFLGLQCRKIVIVDPQELWFDGTLQGAVIILAEKKENISSQTEGVGIRHVRGFEFLDTPTEELFNQTVGINGETVAGKWTKALLSEKELTLLNKVCQNPQVFNFHELASVDVGIVTGANKFFLINDELVKKFHLQEYVKPMFGRSEHCKGVIYDSAQHQTNEKNGHPTNFVYLEDNIESYSAPIKQYIRLGEEEQLNTRYKCRIRKPWYKVPYVYTTEIGMLKRCHDGPRLIYNELGALTTDTAYRIKSSKVSPEKMVYCFINPLTAISAELQGRYYGGGVLELVPSEIEKLIIPIPEKLDFDLKALDSKIRSYSMREVLLENGKHVLGHLGFSDKQVENLVNIWEFLKDRRQRK